MRKISEKQWIKVFRSDAVTVQKGSCCYCHCPITMKTATADHIKARKHGGCTSRNNISASCLECNRLKGHMSETRFKTLIKNPQPGDSIEIWLAWSRRKIFLATERSCSRIRKFAI